MKKGSSREERRNLSIVLSRSHGWWRHIQPWFISLSAAVRSRHWRLLHYQARLSLSLIDMYSSIIWIDMYSSIITLPNALVDWSQSLTDWLWSQSITVVQLMPLHWIESVCRALLYSADRIFSKIFFLHFFVWWFSKFCFCNLKGLYR